MWNPSPKVADCREIARKWGYDIVVVLAVNTKTRKCETVSYGETKGLCDNARRINEQIAKDVEHGIIEIDE